MLRIDLAELIRQSGKHIDVDIDEMPSSDEDVTYLSNVSGQFTITNSGSLILVRGHLKTAIQLECGRCLRDVREPIDADIEEQYTLDDADHATFHGHQVSIVADEENEVPVGLMDGTVMDLGILIRQAVILNTPIGPVCKPDCRGLCPVCGKNRNDPASGCRCEQKPRNTPLAGLRELLKVDEPEPSSNGHQEGEKPGGDNNGVGA